MAIIDIPPDEIHVLEDPIVDAVERLRVDVVEAFAKHDKDLRAEVEKVNRQIRWLVYLLFALVIAVSLTKCVSGKTRGPYGGDNCERRSICAAPRPRI